MLQETESPAIRQTFPFDVVKTVSRALEVELRVTTTIRSLTGETAMTLYMGVDFHPHQQTVCWCDAKTGEIHSTFQQRIQRLAQRFVHRFGHSFVDGSSSPDQFLL